MMPSLTRDVAPRDAEVPATLHLRNIEGKPYTLFVMFRPNRVSYESIPDSDIEAYLDSLTPEQLALVGDDERVMNWRDSFGFCECVTEWDMTGLVNRKGVQVINDDEVIPLEPLYIKMVPASVTLAINKELMARVSPNESKSKRTQRR